MRKMIQNYNKYVSEDFDVWKTLFNRQVKNLKGKAHPEYLRCLGLIEGRSE
jgi:phenylalanine-4-hydroxylase